MPKKCKGCVRYKLLTMSQDAQKATFGWLFFGFTRSSRSVNGVPRRAVLGIGDRNVRERAIQGLCKTILRQRWRVVALTQVGGHQQVEVFVLQRFGNLGSLLI